MSGGFECQTRKGGGGEINKNYFGIITPFGRALSSRASYEVKNIN